MHQQLRGQRGQSGAQASLEISGLPNEPSVLFGCVFVPWFLVQFSCLDKSCYLGNGQIDVREGNKEDPGNFIGGFQGPCGDSLHWTVVVCLR